MVACTRKEPRPRKAGGRLPNKARLFRPIGLLRVVFCLFWKPSPSFTSAPLGYGIVEDSALSSVEPEMDLAGFRVLALSPWDNLWVSSVGP